MVVAAHGVLERPAHGDDVAALARGNPAEDRLAPRHVLHVAREGAERARETARPRRLRSPLLLLRVHHFLGLGADPDPEESLGLRRQLDLHHDRAPAAQHGIEQQQRERGVDEQHPRVPDAVRLGPAGEALDVEQDRRHLGEARPRACAARARSGSDRRSWPATSAGFATGAGSRISRATKTDSRADGRDHVGDRRRRDGGLALEGVEARRGPAPAPGSSAGWAWTSCEALGEVALEGGLEGGQVGQAGLQPVAQGAPPARGLAQSEQRHPTLARASGIWTAKLATSESKPSSARRRWRSVCVSVSAPPEASSSTCASWRAWRAPSWSPCAASTAASSACKRASWGSSSTARSSSPRAAGRFPCSRWIAAASPRLAAERTPLASGVASTTQRRGWISAGLQGAGQRAPRLGALRLERHGALEHAHGFLRPVLSRCRSPRARAAPPRGRARARGLAAGRPRPPPARAGAARPPCPRRPRRPRPPPPAPRRRPPARRPGARSAGSSRRSPAGSASRPRDRGRCARSK